MCAEHIKPRRGNRLYLARQLVGDYRGGGFDHGGCRSDRAGRRGNRAGRDPQVPAGLVIAACLPLNPSLNWRVGAFDRATKKWSGLRGFGINPAEYCEEVLKERIATIPKRAETS